MREQALSVLVVEDDLDMRISLSDMLRDEGYEVAVAANGREALDVLLAAGARFDLILLDLMMPVMNGWQFRKEQMKQTQIAEVPVLVLSAGTHVQEAASSIGAAGFLRKPIKIDAFLTEVAKFAALGRDRRAAGAPG